MKFLPWNREITKHDEKLRTLRAMISKLSLLCNAEYFDEKNIL